LILYLNISDKSFAGGTCCPQSEALCVVDGIIIVGYYYLPSGPCGQPQ